MLDLYDDAKIQFTHDNPLFAFDKLSCERTTQLKLPSTPKNDSVLALARIPAYTGSGMRLKFSAELQDGTLVKSGYLSVSAYDGKDYTAIFVTGEWLGLQNIKNAGKLTDILNTNKWSSVTQSGTTPSYVKTHEFDYPYYRTSAIPPLIVPSLRIYTMLDTALTSLGATYTIPADYFRMFPTIAKGIVSQTGLFSRTIQFPDYQSIPTVATAVIGGAYGLSNIFVVSQAGIGGTLVKDGVTYYYKGIVQQVQAKQAVTITFPDDWDDDIFIGKFVSTPSEFINILEIFQFYGDRSFNCSGGVYSVTGDSLRGRSVDIESGDYFTFIHKLDWNDAYSSSSGDGQGWFFQGGHFQDEDYTIEGGDIIEGNYVREQDQLPDMTLVDLLKTHAALNGKVLNYDETNGLTYDPLTFSSWPIVELDGKITKMGSVERTFADYGQNNIIDFKSGAGVLDVEKIENDYAIYNENLDERKVLQTLPFTEGGAEGTRIYVRPEESDWAVANCDTNDQCMQRVTLPANAGMVQLCTASTKVEVTARMNLKEYNDIHAKTLLLVNGTKYVWTSKKWQNNVATFTLAKI